MMLYMTDALAAWGSTDFRPVVKQAIEALGIANLPLQQGLSRSSHVLDKPVEALIIAVGEDAGSIHVKAGIFYTGIIAGCSCADDPTPVDENAEYCVVALTIDKSTAATTVMLLAE
jgi:hypothetical protein